MRGNFSFAIQYTPELQQAEICLVQLPGRPADAAATKAVNEQQIAPDDQKVCLRHPRHGRRKITPKPL